MVKIFNKGDIVSLSPSSVHWNDPHQLGNSGEVIGSYLSRLNVRWYDVKYYNEWGEAYNVYKVTDLVPV